MRILTLLSWAALIASSAMAQAPNATRADGFRGLILNQTSPEDAVRMMAQTAADKTDRLDVSKVSKWLDPKHKEKIFRQLSFKNVGDFSQIQLSFLENRLMIIELAFKKNVPPGKVNNLFAAEFAVVGAGPSDLPNEPGKYPVRFVPTLY